MLIEVKVPQLSESVAEATLLTWHKKAGRVSSSATRTWSTSRPTRSCSRRRRPTPGVIVKIIKGDGGTVVEQRGHRADRHGSAGAAAAAPAADGERAGAAPSRPCCGARGGARRRCLRRRSSPPKSSVDTAAIAGTGRGGRVTKEDVLHVIEGGAQPAARPAAPRRQRPGAAARAARPAVDLGALGERPEQRVPMSRLRARIAERLVQSQHTAAILTTFNEVNMQPVIDLRNRYQDRFEKEHGVKLGFMSFFVKAAVHALKKFPVVNASIDGNDIVYHGYYDIGIAVGSPRGLVVPILRNADQLSLAEIEKKIADFGKRAQDGKLTIEELTGGTFSISNGGVFGSMLSTPIINPPQSAILGVHATRERPVVENGQVVIRPMNYLALSYDHRIIDGREAVLSLVAIKEALEDPARMLLDI